MRKQVMLKSALRRPIHSLLLIILLGAAAFGFALRVAEYGVVSEEITRIEGYYRSIGVIHNSFDPWGNVNEGVAALADNPLIAFNDIRRVFVGVMDEIQNVNMRQDVWHIEVGTFNAIHIFMEKLYRLDSEYSHQVCRECRICISMKFRLFRIMF
ncbi:MAG: hypothetical protein LBE35_00895 [Clostridiales bacterium]|jgi:hypothetical protein|nr:hypothetical protein [Clostridiales bacterium]